jgi:hypothetical protein
MNKPTKNKITPFTINGIIGIIPKYRKAYINKVPPVKRDLLLILERKNTAIIISMDSLINATIIYISDNLPISSLGPEFIGRSKAKNKNKENSINAENSKELKIIKINTLLNGTEELAILFWFSIIILLKFPPPAFFRLPNMRASRRRRWKQN